MNEHMSARINRNTVYPCRTGQDRTGRRLRQDTRVRAEEEHGWANCLWYDCHAYL